MRQSAPRHSLIWPTDGAVVTEPTDLAIATAHQGFSWVDVETYGRAAHGSRPADGRDAILRMGRVLAGLELIDRDLQARHRHPMLGTPSLHSSIISGGPRAERVSRPLLVESRTTDRRGRAGRRGR